MKSKNLANHIAQLILEKKGYNVTMMDMRSVTTMTDFFVICSADSEIQVKAIMEHIREQLLFQAIKPWHVEGLTSMTWLLIDFVDVVVHIFQPETRAFYTLEKLWGDAKITQVKDTLSALPPSQ